MFIFCPSTSQQIRMLGEAELSRYRGLEALLSDPRLADPDPSRAKKIPENEAEFLQAYEGRQKEIIDFIRAKGLFTLPEDIGAFHIRQLPARVFCQKQLPGGLVCIRRVSMTCICDGTYYIPAFTPKSSNGFLFARPLRIPARSWPMKVFRGIFSNNRSPISCITRHAARAQRLCSSRRDGLFIRKRCSCGPDFTRITPRRKGKSFDFHACARRAWAWT